MLHLAHTRPVLRETGAFLRGEVVDVRSLEAAATPLATRHDRCDTSRAFDEERPPADGVVTRAEALIEGAGAAAAVRAAAALIFGREARKGVVSTHPVVGCAEIFGPAIGIGGAIARAHTHAATRRLGVPALAQ